MGMDLPLHVTDGSSIDDMDLANLYPETHIQEGLLGGTAPAPWEPRQDAAKEAAGVRTITGETPEGVAASALHAVPEVADRSGTPSVVVNAKNSDDVSVPSVPAVVQSVGLATEEHAEGTARSSSSRAVPSVGAKRRAQELKESQKRACLDDQSSEVRHVLWGFAPSLDAPFCLTVLQSAKEGEGRPLAPGIVNVSFQVHVLKTAVLWFPRHPVAPTTRSDAA